MGPTKDLQPSGENLRKAVRWICDSVLANPEKKRADIIKEAEIKFDLSPKECAFLDEKISKEIDEGKNE